MSDFNPAPDSASIVSVTDRVRKVQLKAPAAFVHFLGNTAAFVGAEEHILLVDEDGAWTNLGVHDGGILCSASDGKRIVSGGDDGKLVAVNPKGETETLATDAWHRWIDNVALHADGTVAWSASKTAFVKTPKGEEKSLDVPSTVGGLAFAPKGLRVAVAHYNGVTLWVPEYGGEARSAGMERLASRRNVQRRQSFPSSPRCTNPRCMAGGSPIRSTCG